MEGPASALNPEKASEASQRSARRWEAENPEVHARRIEEYWERIGSEEARKRKRGYRTAWAENNPEAAERCRVKRNANKRKKRAELKKAKQRRK